MTDSVGRRFVDAVAAKDAAALTALIADEVDFKGLTGGPHLVEQQVYYRERSGQVSYARVVCSGDRPAL
jgi:hypothetical protein